jgi:hypothetical protein
MRYVVRRLNWQEPTPGRFIRLPGWHEVAAFDTFEAAEVDRRGREAEVRVMVNPFACGDAFAELTALPAPLLYDWLMDAGLDPPPPDAPLVEWGRWWAAAGPGMSDGQRARTWEGLHVLRLYETAERPAVKALYALIETTWDYDEDEYDGTISRYDGGRVVSAFRAAADAAREFAGCGAIAEEEYDERFVTGAAREAGRDPFRDPKPAGFRHRLSEVVPPGGVAAVSPCEVVSVPVLSKRSIGGGRTAFHVVRLSWAWSEERPGRFWRPSASEVGVPVAAFLDRPAAEVFAWELDAAARAYLNPFRFGHPVHHTSIEQFGYRAMLRDVGLVPPADDWQFAPPYIEREADAFLGEGSPSWYDWWAATADGMTRDQRDTVRDLLDRLRFHMVVEVRVG